MGTLSEVIEHSLEFELQVQLNGGQPESTSSAPIVEWEYLSQKSILALGHYSRFFLEAVFSYELKYVRVCTYRYNTGIKKMAKDRYSEPMSCFSLGN